MKFTRALLSVALAAPFASMAYAGVNITPFAGYHHSGKAWNEQRKDLGFAKDNGTAKGIALGAELTPSIAVELEYLDASGDERRLGNATPINEFDQKNASINLLVNSDLITQNYDNPLKPYLLFGLGMASYDVKNKTAGNTVASDDYFVTNFGLGAKFRFSDMVALKTELRGIYNPRANWVEGLALLGLQATIGGHLKPVIPEPPMLPEFDEEPKPEPKPIVVKQPVDSDGDGVIDARDRCPNTPRGTKVDARGCPIPLKMELRVFFDKNKSNIKAQYRPEVAKVANAMRKNRNATALIEGHTSKTGPRRLNERLSLARANAVKGMLANQYGINPARMAAKGYAWDRPIAPNNTDEGRALNRRVYAVIK